MATELLAPLRSFALTSGPTQPEARQFAVAGTSDMVDMFSGSLKYNIPVMDIDGYPVNLNYASGRNIDEEASWVGLGWNLNVGAINRQLRGLPDDFNGDKIITEHYTKPRVQVGGRLTVKSEVKGINILKLKGTLSLDVFNDSYTGIGAQVGANADVNVDIISAGSLTMGMGLNAGINSHTSDGVSTSLGIGPTASFVANDMMASVATAEMSSTLSLGYNTRQGLKDLSLSQSFGVRGVDLKGEGRSSISGDIMNFSYNTPPFTPSIGIPHTSTASTYSVDIGGVAWIVFGGFGFTGYKNRQEVTSLSQTNPGFGYLNAEHGKEHDNAMMDFMREKDNPAFNGLPNLPVPIATPDLFSYTGQAGSGQFRLYRHSGGVECDPQYQDVSTDNTDGLDLGLGAYVHGGVTFYNRNIKSTTGKWKKDNQFNTVGDFQPANGIKEEAAYFKMIGEANVADQGFVNAIQSEDVVKVQVNRKATTTNLINGRNVIANNNALKKTDRQVRRTPITYLKAFEAEKAGLDKFIQNYPFNDSATFQVPSCSSGTVTSASAGTPVALSRTSSGSQHFSEITVHGDDGKRMVYGLPVQNIQQDEYSFATVANGPDLANNLITYTTDVFGRINHTAGVDNYYHHEKTPAYASSFLLTAVLSPDYVDVTGDGITDDDLGTAVKFNYSKVNKNYKWRSPYLAKKALLSRGQNADVDDDKASFVYGEKELWYLQSIETKTKIMYFITTDRDDALGVQGVHGGKETGVKQKRLSEIRLYAKTDLTKPIKTAVFEYDYSLCTGVPNSMTNQGKLTLKGLHFTYGNSTKGALHPYKFYYNNDGQQYGYLLTDRWGMFKGTTDNNQTAGIDLANDQFPYSIQDKTRADAHAAEWNLSQIDLPSGGTISVDYEAGDYAYVQDKQAMQMIKVNNLINADGSSTEDLGHAKGIQVDVGGGLPSAGLTMQWFKDHYLNGESVMYAKLFVNMTDNPDLTDDKNYDFVPCYGEISGVSNPSGNIVNVFFKDMNDGVVANPFAMAAWQKMRNEYPRYAYPGYNNRINDNVPIKAALSAIVHAVGNLTEVVENFNHRALRKGFCHKILNTKSFARIVKWDGVKLGGDARVKRLRIKDGWTQIEGSSTPIDATYGQEYSYQQVLNGKTVSSGVASYEPGVGNDENPMRLPIAYTQKIKGALSNFFYLERPFGEALFPGPQVGYSKVVVRDLNENGVADPDVRTGFTVHEFYTARDFPVEVQQTENPLVLDYKPTGWFNFFGASIHHEMSMSQGYVIKVNDMHGKPKGEAVYNQSGQEVSSAVYYYNSENMDAGKQRLKNIVDVVDEKGNITTQQVIGREIELYTDMRESESDNKGRSIQIGFDIVPGIFSFPLPIPHWPRKDNDQYLLFRSASTLKVVQYAGQLQKVVKRINGSTVTSKNLLFDKYTGDPVVTQTNNEFDDPVYSVNIPAYWVYGKMGGAYQNLNALLGMSTDANGVINSSVLPMLASGDEVVDLFSTKHYWVINSAVKGSTVNSYKLIDKYGFLMPKFNGSVRIIRSGYRNQLTSSVATYSCLQNPVETSGTNKVFRFASDQELGGKQVLDAKAILYDEVWAQRSVCGCPSGYTLSADSSSCIKGPTTNTDVTFGITTTDPNADYGLKGGFIYNTAGVVVDSFLMAYGVTCPTGGGSMSKMKVNSVASVARSQYEMDTAQNQSLAQTSNVTATSTSLCGRLNLAGIWWAGTSQQEDVWRGVTACFTVSNTSGTIYVGYAADNGARVYIDDVLVDSFDDYSQDNFRKWKIRPVHALAGKHTYRLEGHNLGSSRSIAMDIYDTGNRQVLHDASSSSILGLLCFSTSQLVGQDVQSYYYGLKNMITYHHTCDGGPIDVCADQPVCDRIPLAVVNPYTTGFLGNWRPVEEKVFEVNRTEQQVFNPSYNGQLVRSSGYYQTFTPYWTFTGKWNAGVTNASRWVSARFITLYDKYGQELENHDALNRYSGALYGFRGQLPTAVASNAQQREIFYDGFEDYKYQGLCGTAQVCSPDSFNIYKVVNGNLNDWLDASMAHSGNYSLKLNSALHLSAPVYNTLQRSTDYKYISTDSYGQYIRNFLPGATINGFNPMPSKKYVFTAWVNDGDPLSSNINLTLVVNDNNSIPLIRKATAEGWKLVEGTIDLPAGNTIRMMIGGGSNVRIDDIRLFPFDAEIKTYAYDDQTLRLMAEMDENNFATFYEYDAEGTLIRVKKETDRGIMTIKETRSTYRVGN